MNLVARLAVVAVAASLCLADSPKEVRVTRSNQQRLARGFKTMEMSTARGFGKRDRPVARTERDVEHEHQPPGRSSRGTPTFKSPAVGIARDFGKRNSLDQEEADSIAASSRQFHPKSVIMVLPELSDYAKRIESDDRDAVYNLDNFWETLEASPEKETQDGNDEKALESIPVEWFVNEMQNNVEFARSVVRKFIDVNQDGVLSSDELLRNVM